MILSPPPSSSSYRDSDATACGKKIRNSQIFRKISQDKQYHQLQTRSKSVKSKLGFLAVRSVHYLGRAYFSVQYCAVLMKKCAVLDAKMCSIEIWNVLSSVNKS